jgi:alkaline phosphatase D
MTDTTDPASEQYDGWPKTISQTDNYGRPPVAWLPEVNVIGDFDPVLWVLDAELKTVYSLALGKEPFQPWVFADGEYTLHVGTADFHRFKRWAGRAISERRDAGSVTFEF